MTIASVELLGVRPVIASAAGFLTGAAVKYALNYFVAFRSGQRHAVALARFVVTLAVFFVLNSLLFLLLNERYGLHYILAQVLTTGLLVPPSYLVSRYWVFAGEAK